MKSRAELLAELEEKRRENNEMAHDIDELSILGAESAGGYDPYDNPSFRTEFPDGADITARRRKIMLRTRGC